MQPHPLLELDFSNKLEITINNKNPVVLTDLTMALLGVGQQFERFIENETNEQHAACSHHVCQLPPTCRTFNAAVAIARCSAAAVGHA